MVLHLFTSVILLAAAVAQAGPPLLLLTPVDATPKITAKADGVSARWGDAELVAEGFSGLDKQLRQSAGKLFELRVIFGWRTHGVSQMPAVLDQEKSAKQSATVRCPLLWAPEYRAAVRERLKVYGDRYRGKVDYVCVTGLGRSDELYTPAAVQKQPGYSEKAWLDAARQHLRDYHAAFGPDQRYTLGISSVFPGDRLRLTKRLLEVVEEELPRCTLVVHSLKATTNMDWELWRLCKSRGAWAAECVGPSKNRGRFGGPLSKALSLAAGAEFVRVYPPDLQR